MDVPGSKRIMCLSSFCPWRILGGAWQSKRKTENFSYVNNDRKKLSQRKWHLCYYSTLVAVVQYRSNLAAQFWVILDQWLSIFFLHLGSCRFFFFPFPLGAPIPLLYKESSCTFLMGDSDLSVGLFCWSQNHFSFKKSLLRQTFFPSCFPFKEIGNLVVPNDFSPQG